jgi:hypothetical protein
MTSTDTTDVAEIAEGLSEPMRDFMRIARTSRDYGRDGLIDIAGDGPGVATTARALMRRGLLVCVHPGGPSWGEFSITPLGRAVAAYLQEHFPKDP